MNFVMKWTEALKQRLLGQQLDVISRDGKVFARYDTFHVELDSTNNLTIELRQGKHVLAKNSAPVVMGTNTTVRFEGVSGELLLTLN
jgi:hypothetical protein